MHTRIIFTPKTKKLLNDIDKMLFHYPDLREIALSDAHFNLILDACPDLINKSNISSLPYKGIFLIKMRR